MRRIITLICVVSLCFLIVFPVSADTPLLWYDYDFNGVNMDLVFLDGSGEYGSQGYNNIYNLYESSKQAGVRHYYYIMQKGHVPSEPYSLGYVLYMYQAESEEPYPFTFDGYRILARGDLYIAAYVLVSGLEGHGWKFLAEDHYDAGSYLMTPDQVFWSSDDILSSNGTVAIGGDEYWKDVRIDDAYTPEEDPNNPEDSDDSLLGSILAWLSSIRDGILDIPDAFLGAIGSLATQLLDGIKGVFLPDTEYIQQRFDQFVETLGQQWNFDTEFFTSLFNEEKPVGDITGDYKIHGVGTLSLKFFDASFFRQGIEFFRPFIRGFLVLLMVFFNIKMVLSFIRQDAGMATGKAVEISNGDRKGS